MDLFAQSLVAAGARWRLGRAGLALPSAMFALVALSVLVVGLFAIADLSAKAVRNRQRSAHAVHIAEAGLAHAVGALRGPLRRHHFTRILLGSDSLPSPSDNGRITGYGLAANQQIPDSGKTITVGTDTGRYYVTLFDDDADPDGNFPPPEDLTDMNGRLVARCKGVTRDGSVAEIEAIVGAIPFPGIVTDGDLDVSASGVQLTGACGGVHSNGKLLGSGSMTVTTKATEYGSGSLTTTPARVSGQPKIDIPNLNPLQYCAGADYVLKANGYIVYNGGADSVLATGSQQFGWKQSGSSPVVWKTETTTPNEGTFCVHGNAVVGTDIGSAAAPRKMSVIATGSIEIPAKPFLRAEQDDGIMLLAGGDVSINGDPALGSSSTYDGMIYAGSDCKIEGAPTLNGQFICNDNPDPVGSVNLTDVMKISGAATLRFDCSANVFNKRRVLFWYPKVGV